MPKYQDASLLAHGGHYLDIQSGAVVPPIQTSSTYARDEQGELYNSSRIYARDQSDNSEQAEAVICQLEGGQASRLFASGMAAATAIVHSLRPGQRLVAPTVMYWSLRSWMIDFCNDWGIELAFYDTDDGADLSRVVRAKQTHMVWLESPANPTWQVVDIAAAAQVAHAANAQLVVDATVLTPLLCKPIALGADLVFHSATKYLNGHSDVVAGVVTCAQEDQHWQRICSTRAQLGGILSPFSSWLLLRGMRTLHLRLERACSNAQVFAEHFTNHSQVVEVMYPGLTSHPQHEIAKHQFNNGFGGMLSIRFKGGRQQTAIIMGKLKLMVRATSLGGVESLVEHRALIEGPTSPVPDDLLRFSIGCEAIEDLIADLEQAL
jgi:cystathionine gamma-synthase